MAGCGSSMSSGPHTTLSSIYGVVRNAYAKRLFVERRFQKKTNGLVQKHIGTAMGQQSAEAALFVNFQLFRWLCENRLDCECLLDQFLLVGD
jgi:hypothetical protein